MTRSKLLFTLSLFIIVKRSFASHHNNKKIDKAIDPMIFVSYLITAAGIILFIVLGIVTSLLFCIIRVTPKNGIVEKVIRYMLRIITDYLPVKVIRDSKGKAFLIKYHVFAFTFDGPGIVIHRFVASDPGRGFHDHPWSHSASFVLAGGYEERLDPTHPDAKGRMVMAG